ncbi:MAG: hypothetical protein JW715_00385 [Sedimentisphaerales bacterium]|nr:hypothetical protein [Sedimentisphaerales bacterium]
MKKCILVLGLLAIVISAGCNSDIVCTERMKMLEHKCVYLAPLNSEDPHVGQVLRDALEKEFLRQGIAICDSDTATVFITGSTFLTIRGSGAAAGQSIESISLIARDSAGDILMSASYDNKDRLTAGKVAREFGTALAKKLK